ncbi:hypothetical protein H6F71_16030 [Microcoleus sp. FACHB-61]|nr:hypothetical protein [Microcoleus sp. FACHB-61]
MALGFVQKLLKQYSDTKNIPRRSNRWRIKCKLKAEQLLLLAQLIEANNDATIAEFHYLLYQKTGVTISFDNNGKNDKTIEYDFPIKNLLSFRQR